MMLTTASPTISAVICTRAGSRTLARALRSVAAQTRRPFETIVVSPEGDPPRTEATLQVRWVTVPNRGAAAARNAGVAAARGSHVAFLDDDDCWYPEKVSRMTDAAARYPDADLLYSEFECVDANGQRLWRPHVQAAGRDVYRQLVVTNFIATSTVVVRPASFHHAGGFDETIRCGEDWDLWIRLARQFPVVRVPGVLAAYEYLSAGSVSSSTNPERWLADLRRVVDKTLAADPSLHRIAPRIRGGLAFTSGKTYLSAGRPRDAAAAFFSAWTMRWSDWRSAAYLLMTIVRPARYVLPPTLQYRLRLSAPR